VKDQNHDAFRRRDKRHGATAKGKIQAKHRHQFIPQILDTITSLLVTDKKYSLWVEVKDDPEMLNEGKAMGLGAYSNSKATVLSYASIFESLWRQSETYEQLRESLTQLDDTRTRLHDMQQYVDYILKERHKHNC
jgi:hypothetical protein